MSKKQKVPKASYEDLGKMMVNIYESGYITANQSYKSSFLKGVAGGVGGVIGATIVIALIAWILSLFTSIPIIGPLSHDIQNTIKSSQ